MDKHVGAQTIKFHHPPSIIATASVAGPKEGEGPLAKYFDVVSQDVLFGKDSWEKAESEVVRQAMELVVQKANMKIDDIQYILAGDLQNQNTGSSFGIRSLNRPFFGLFGACSTMGEAMSLGSILVDGGYADHVIAGASSHFCAAEKTFRFPLEMGSQRPMTAQWTVTGDGCVILASQGQGPYVTYATTGKIVDMGIKDANNMGAAMAPAAIDVLTAHFKDTGRDPNYYDLIATGDLGYVGHEITIRLMRDSGYDISKNYTDCGIEIFDKDKQDTHAGGSGCGCAAITFAGYLYHMMTRGKLNKILLVPTGALLSTITTQQGESIPAIAHAVAIENTIC